MVSGCYVISNPTKGLSSNKLEISVLLLGCVGVLSSRSIRRLIVSSGWYSSSIVVGIDSSFTIIMLLELET